MGDPDGYLSHGNVTADGLYATVGIYEKLRHRTKLASRLPTADRSIAAEGHAEGKCGSRAAQRCA